MTISFWRLGWRTLWRDLRSGDLRLLIVAVTLAVAALTAVGFFADRLKGGLQRDARQLLGGDAVVSSDNPTPASFVAKARALGLSVVTTIGLSDHGPRAGRHRAGRPSWWRSRWWSPAIRLRGRLRVASAPDAPDAPTRDIPAPGQAWVDAALLEALGLKMGDTLLLGDARLTIDTHHRDRARPGRRLHELCAARDDQHAGHCRHRPGAAGQPPDLPHGRGRRRRAGAALCGLGRCTGQAGRRRPARRAGRVAAERSPRNEPDAGPGREIPEPGGAAGRHAQRGGGGPGGARLCRQPSGRLRHAARAGPEPAHHRRQLCA